MNRRGFFGVVGAAIAGAVLGGKVEGNPFHVRTFVADEVRTGTSRYFPKSGLTIMNDSSSFVLGGAHNHPLFVSHGEIRRIDGKPIPPGDLYIDDNGVIQLGQRDNLPTDPSWYDAWL